MVEIKKNNFINKFYFLTESIRLLLNLILPIFFSCSLINY